MMHYALWGLILFSPEVLANYHQAAGAGGLLAFSGRAVPP